MVVVPLSPCSGVPVELAERAWRVSGERRWAIGSTETAVPRLASATRPAEQPARAVLFPKVGPLSLLVLWHLSTPAEEGGERTLVPSAPMLVPAVLTPVPATLVCL